MWDIFTIDLQAFACASRRTRRITGRRGGRDDRCLKYIRHQIFSNRVRADLGANFHTLIDSSLGDYGRDSLYYRKFFCCSITLLRSSYIVFLGEACLGRYGILHT